MCFTELTGWTLLCIVSQNGPRCALLYRMDPSMTSSRRRSTSSRRSDPDAPSRRSDLDYASRRADPDRADWDRSSRQSELDPATSRRYGADGYSKYSKQDAYGSRSNEEFSSDQYDEVGLIYYDKLVPKCECF